MNMSRPEMPVPMLRGFSTLPCFDTAPILRRMELVVTLLVVGALLLLLETVLPGMVAGIVGGCCLLAGVALAYVKLGATAGNWVLGVTVIAVIAGFGIWASVFPKTRFGRAFISSRAIGDVRAERPELLHQAGTAFTQLRPSGTALISGRRVDVVSEGALIEKGTPIKVVAIEGMRVVVRATAEHSPETSNS